MGWFKNTKADREYREAQREHNARFNRRDVDPDSDEYLASHDRVVAADKARKQH